MLEQFDRRASKSSLEKVRVMAKKSEDFLVEYGEIISKLAKTNDGTHPPDLAKESFWQFIKSNRGEALMTMLSIGGMIGYLNQAIIIFYFFRATITSFMAAL